MLRDIISKCVLGEYSQDAAEHRARLALAAEQYKKCSDCDNDLVDEETMIITVETPDEEPEQRVVCYQCFTRDADALREMLKADSMPGRVYADSWNGRVSWSMLDGESTVEKEFLE